MDKQIVGPIRKLSRNTDFKCRGQNILNGSLYRFGNGQTLFNGPAIRTLSYHPLRKIGLGRVGFQRPPARKTGEGFCSRGGGVPIINSRKWADLSRRPKEAIWSLCNLCPRRRQRGHRILVGEWYNGEEILHPRGISRGKKKIYLFI